MTSAPDRHKRVQSIFLEACGLRAAERSAFLERACGGDLDLRREVEELLALDLETDQWVDILGFSDDQGDPAEGSIRELLERVSRHTPSGSRYRLEGEIARGGMGTILRVWDESLRRYLAMKVVLGKGEAVSRGDTPSADPRTLGRFLEEAQVTGQLDHPGIVPVHELGLDAEGRVYFTMKLVKGRTLKDVFDELARGEGGWTQLRVLGLILKVCEAMSYAHAKGVIHRDLKPANVMVGKFGEVYVMDWGLAKLLGRRDDRDIRIREQPLLSSEVRSDRKELAADAPDSPLYTMDGDVVGTPAYMPPEQAAGDIAAMGPHSDVYAVGAMLYHLLAGHVPYVAPGAKASNYAVWRWVTEGPPRSLDLEAPEAPLELVAICNKAMSRDPGSRYPDMTALAADLSAYVEGRVVTAYETGTWAETRKWVKRNKPLAASLLAALLLLVAGLVVSLNQMARADAKAAEAQAQQQRAEKNERQAREETAKVLRLSDMKILQELQRQADALWPAYPERIDELESWLARARALRGRLPGHIETLMEMRDRAGPWTAVERARDRETHPRADELVGKRAEMEGLIAQLERGLQGEARELADKRVAELEQEVAALEEEVAARRTWSLGTPQEQWHHDALVELIENVQQLPAELLAEDVVTADRGWSVPRRLAFARELEAAFSEGGPYARAWDAALPAIRAAYAGLDLMPQSGLLPLGPDPDSGLWEFAHLMTGEPAERGPDGRLALTEATGVVLVLLPAGRFWMGAQAIDPAGRNYDPRTKDGEGPVHQVELSAYLLSKYELTQGQWLRLTGQNPSWYRSQGPAPMLHPLEQVSWQDCMSWLPRAGLALPTEAQWEYGARAGTDTPWWTGADRESLRERNAGNLADQAAARAGAPWPAIQDWPELDDGFAVHAPVGSFAANAFGLHDVVGNVWEWVLDGFDWDFYAWSPERDPFFPWSGSNSRMCRGGSYINGSTSARVAERGGNGSPTIAININGVRPSMRLRSP